MFEAPAEAALPTLVRYCKRRLEAGDRIEVELHRPDTGIGVSRTQLVLLRWEGGREEAPQIVEWDDGVHAGLVDLGVRAVDPRQEGERFSLGIRSALRKLERSR